MRQFQSCIAIAALLALVLAAGCGHGEGYRVPYDPVLITSATLPALSSGEDIDFEVPIGGGCGGPYVLQLIGGDMPLGLELDFSTLPDGTHRHHIVGSLREAGSFNFTLRITDTACDPDSTATMNFSWEIPIGQVRLVGAVPGLIPEATYTDPDKWVATPPNEPIDAIETIVYGTFTSVEFIAAGGTPPYRMFLEDDPLDPNDGDVPFGMGIAINSTVLVGTPSSVGPGGRPFLMTLRVEDSLGNTATRKVQWKIDTPKVILTTTSLNSGRCGTSYSDSITIVDGVPPLAIEMIDGCPADDPTKDDGIFDDVSYPSGGPPVVGGTYGLVPGSTGPIALDPVTGYSTNAHIGRDAAYAFGASRTSYPLETDNSTNLGPYPSEGLYVDADGALGGVPRRRGDYNLFFHAFSSVVPNEKGQHAFVNLMMSIVPSEQLPLGPRPAFALNEAMAEEGTFTPATVDGYPTLPEAEKTIIYNPDVSTHPDDGLQCLADGGVPHDGMTDRPHKDDRTTEPTEVADAYLWDADMDYGGSAATLTGLSMFSPGGLFGTVDQAAADGLIRQGRQLIEIQVTDAQLPLSLQNAQSQVFGIAIGPDTVITAMSNESLSATESYYSYSNRHAWNDDNLVLKKFQAFSGNPTLGDLSYDDLTNMGLATDDLSDTSLTLDDVDELLSTVTGGMDFMRITVNPTGWWDDLHNMNPRSARSFQHSDRNAGYSYYGEYGQSYSYSGNWQPPASTLELPDADNVKVGANPLAQGDFDAASGIYANGGKMYAFESGDFYGLFVIRQDGKIYIPWAKEKSTSAEGFGDGCLINKGDQIHSLFRTVQMTVSPDGRVAALKLKSSKTNLYESASNSSILLVSLTGERLFDAGTEYYKEISNGSTSQSGVAPASSMVLTNGYLYYLIGTQIPTSYTTSSTPLRYMSWRGYYVMRYALFGGASSTEVCPSKSGDTLWTQRGDSGTSPSGSTMQTAFHYHGTHYSASSVLGETYTYYGNWPYHRYWHENGMNFNERGTAPMPFRVNANGDTIAILAGPDTSSYSSSSTYKNYCWVDRNGAGARRVSAAARRATRGGSRGSTIDFGPYEYGVAWGQYTGPTTGLEISDDGDAIAFVYTTENYTTSFNMSTSWSSGYLRYNRQNVIVTTSTGTDWSGFSERDITASTFSGSSSTSSHHKWRFGALAFTADGDGLVFWAGAPVYNTATTSNYYISSMNYCGCFYIHDMDDTNRVTSMCATSDGGSPDGAGKVYTNSSPMNPSSTSGQNNRYGAIHPFGGFYSKNRNFMYVVSMGPLSSSNPTPCRLVGLNIRSTNAANDINDHDDGRAFTPGNWPTRRGFVPFYYYYYVAYYPHYYGYGSDQQGNGMQVMARDSGWVFWGLGNCYYGPQASYYYYGCAAVYQLVAYSCYGYGGPGMFGFNPDLGGDVAQLDPPGMSAYGSNVTSPRELLNFIEVTPDGKRLLFVTTQGNYGYYRYTKNEERVNYVTNIDFDTSDGSMHADFDRSDDSGRIESSAGRAGEAMSHATGSLDAYYGYKSSAGNERDQEMVRARFNAATKTYDVTRFTSITGRFNVLHVTR